jgi:hypothetical protein
MIRFKVEHVLDLEDRGVFVLARQLDEGDFSVGLSSSLGGAPLREYLDQPRVLKSDGEVDLSYFAFHLINRDHGARFSVGDVVSLEPSLAGQEARCLTSDRDRSQRF